MAICNALVERRYNTGVGLSRGRDSWRRTLEPCGREADESGVCARHRAAAAKLADRLAARKAAQT